MIDELTQTVRRDFEEWSGGFPPESEYQITVYVDYARCIENAELVREILRDWMGEEWGIEPLRVNDEEDAGAGEPIVVEGI